VGLEAVECYECEIGDKDIEGWASERLDSKREGYAQSER